MTVIVASAVLVYVQVGVFPAATTARTVVSPGSKPAVAPWAKRAADAGADGDAGAIGGADDAGERPAGLGRLHDVLGPELGGGEGERRVGRRVGDRGVAGEGGREAGAGAGEVEGRRAAHALLLDVERGVLGVGVRAGRGVAGVDDHPHGGVAGVEAGAARRGEGAAAARADGDDGAVRRADDVGEREAGLGRLHDVLGPELGGREGEGGSGRGVGARGVAGEGGRQAGAGAG